MGIHQFVGGWLKRKYKMSFNNIRFLPKNIDSLFIDCNGIFHNSAQKIYLYGKYNDDNRELFLSKKDKKELLDEHTNDIIETINTIYDTFKPKHNFVLAPDGIANFGKMNQQRQRRYKNAGKTFFDSNAITPGTELMVTIDSKMKHWIRKKEFTTKHILYSSHLMVGEGEHKIYDFIRKNKIRKTPGTHLIYGLDSDLIILSLLSPLHNIYLIREDTGETLDINKLKKSIYNDLNWGNCNSKLIMQDFSILCMFIGNDFLPKFPSIIDIKHMMTLSFTIYKKNKVHLTDYDNTIIWTNLHIFFKEFVKLEKECYIQNCINPKSLPYPEYKKSFKNNEFDYTKFSKLWYKKHGNSKTTMVKEYLKTLQWVQYYYTKGFNEVSNTHYYKFFYTPLATDIMEYLNDESNFLQLSKHPKNASIHFVHQHLIVLPPSSLPLIDGKYHTLYNDLKNPTSFSTKLEGVHCFRCKMPCTCLDYMSIAYIPHIQKSKILKLKLKPKNENLIEII